MGSTTDRERSTAYRQGFRLRIQIDGEWHYLASVDWHADPVIATGLCGKSAPEPPVETGLSHPECSDCIVLYITPPDPESVDGDQGQPAAEDRERKARWQSPLLGAIPLDRSRHPRRLPLGHHFDGDPETTYRGYCRVVVEDWDTTYREVFHRTCGRRWEDHFDLGQIKSSDPVVTNRVSPDEFRLLNVATFPQPIPMPQAARMLLRAYGRHYQRPEVSGLPAEMHDAVIALDRSLKRRDDAAQRLLDRLGERGADGTTTAEFISVEPEARALAESLSVDWPAEAPLDPVVEEVAMALGNAEGGWEAHTGVPWLRERARRMVSELAKVGWTVTPPSDPESTRG